MAHKLRQWHEEYSLSLSLSLSLLSLSLCLSLSIYLSLSISLSLFPSPLLSSERYGIAHRSDYHLKIHI